MALATKPSKHSLSDAHGNAPTSTSTTTTQPALHTSLVNALMIDEKFLRLKQQIQDEFLKLDSSQRGEDGTASSAARSNQALASFLTHHPSFEATLRSIILPHYQQLTILDPSLTPPTIKPTPIIPQLPEPFDYILQARCEWEKRLRFELRAVAKKQGRPLIQLREVADKLANGATVTDTKPIASSTHTINVPAPVASEFQVRFVYTAEDLLEIISAIRNPNQMPSIAPLPAQTRSSTTSAPPTQPLNTGWGLINLELPVLSMSEFVRKYSALSPSHRQIGVDDTVLGMDWFMNERLKTGEELLATANSASASATTAASSLAALRLFAKTGLPSSLRPAYWARLLEVTLPLSSTKMSHYHSLLSSVNTWSLLTDSLLQFDIQDGPGDDEAFFVFHEQLEEMMLAFSRDTELRTKASLLLNTAPLLAKPSKQLKDQLERLQAATTPIDKKSSSTATSSAASTSSLQSQLLDAVPPNRLIPFHRLVYFATPMCFLYSQTSEAYYVFRAMYAKYFCRLSIISSAPSTILSLSRCFEVLLATRAPNLVHKCLSFGVHPLQYSFSWLFSGFSGFLEVDQLLLLWDRILAWDSLDLLPILAAAIWVWREGSILRAKNKSDIIEVMRELMNIQVIPLLQHFLFST